MLSINELEAMSGVNRRNIRFYVQQEILPPPEGAGLGARYDEEHLLRLKAIPVLRNRGMRLDEIRSFLTRSSRRELERMLQAPQPLPGAVRRKAGSEVTGRACVRYAVAPGVEITIDADASPTVREKVTTLIHEAERLFGSTEGETR